MTKIVLMALVTSISGSSFAVQIDCSSRDPLASFSLDTSTLIAEFNWRGADLPIDCTKVNEGFWRCETSSRGSEKFIVKVMGDNSSCVEYKEAGSVEIVRYVAGN